MDCIDFRSINQTQKLYHLPFPYPVYIIIKETIRNLIGRFFRCDVCRTNFITMYDNCGHDHCARLSNELPFISSSKTSGNHDQSEVAMWLWEVHNAGK